MSWARAGCSVAEDGKMVNQVTTQDSGEGCEGKDVLMKAVVPMEVIERKIYLIRREKVMLSSDLAELYGVEPKV